MQFKLSRTEQEVQRHELPLIQDIFNAHRQVASLFGFNAERTILLVIEGLERNKLQVIITEQHVPMTVPQLRDVQTRLHPIGIATPEACQNQFYFDMVDIVHGSFEIGVGTYRIRAKAACRDIKCRMHRRF